MLLVFPSPSRAVNTAASIFLAAFWITTKFAVPVYGADFNLDASCAISIRVSPNITLIRDSLDTRTVADDILGDARAAEFVDTMINQQRLLNMRACAYKLNGDTILQAVELCEDDSADNNRTTDSSTTPCVTVATYQGEVCGEAQVCDANAPTFTASCTGISTENPDCALDCEGLNTDLNSMSSCANLVVEPETNVTVVTSGGSYTKPVSAAVVVASTILALTAMHAAVVV